MTSPLSSVESWEVVVVEKLVVKFAVDPNKRINAVVAVDATGSVFARGTFTNRRRGSLT